MTWAEQLVRIRRFLRDPDGDIWSDAFLLRLYNDEQFDLFNKLGLNETVKAVRIPPMFYSTYLQDWEWTHIDHADGEVWKSFQFHDAEETVFSSTWESQLLSGVDASETDSGHHFTHPWEALADGVTPGDIPPLHAADGFHRMLFIAFDRGPIEATTLKEIASTDPSWRTRTGVIQSYYRDETISDYLMPYPIPTVADWQDTGEGEADPDTSQYGSTTLDVDNNLLMVFEKVPTELSATTDESDFAKFVQKYVEYGVIERAYGANTDGRITSLSEYWGYRKKIGYKALRIFKNKRTQDRDYCLVTKGVPAKSTRRHPRLPDAYPAQW